MKMRIISMALLVFGFNTIIFAQEPEVDERQPVFYSFFINVVPDSFSFPLLGFINIAKGNQQNPQIGFVNLNAKALTGMQLGYVNTVGADLMGLQGGFINTVGGSVTGPQFGFVNASGGKMQGTQFGFINTIANGGQGIQAGFVNAVEEDFQGIRAGFINTTSGNFKGAKIGFINSSKKLDGIQIGFINYIDTVENGIPVGFLSVVKKGGYKAFELSANEMYPLNFAFKIGVKQFYTTFNLSYNDALKNNFSAGFGIGSLIKLTEYSFINPEYSTHNFLQHTDNEWNMNQLSQLSVNYVHNLNYGFSLVAGPTMTWQNNHNNETNSFMEPIFAIYKNEINSRNKIHIGANVGVRYKISRTE